MATLFKTRTDYSEGIMEELQRVAGETFDKKNTKKRRIESATWGGVFLVLAIWLWVKSQMFALPAVLLVLGGVMLGRGIFFYKFTAMMTARYMKKRKMPMNSNSFEFEEDEIVAFNSDEATRYPYTDCSELAEANECIFFIINNKGGLMFEKKNVEGGSVEQLRALLEEKCGHTIKWVGKGADPRKV